MTDRDRIFEQHLETQRQARLKLTPLQRLQWLQQAKEFARRWAGAAARQRALKNRPR